MMPLRIAVIGCGWVARFGHGPSYAKYARENPGTELSACCDLDGERAGKFMQDFGFRRAYTEYGKMLDMEKPDAVCLNVPESLTRDIALDVLERRIPLLMEKPPGVSLEETLQLKNAVRKAGVVHRVAWNRRYMPLMARMKDLLLKAATEGSVQSLHYEMYRIERTEDNFEDTAIHGIDTVRVLLESDYARLRFDYPRIDCKGKPVSNLFICGEMLTGTYVSLHFQPVSGIVMERIRANVEDGTVFMDMPVWDRPGTRGGILYYRHNEIVREWSVEEEDPPIPDADRFGFYPEDKSFFDSVRLGSIPENDLENSLQTMEILDCLKRKTPEYRKE